MPGDFALLAHGEGGLQVGISQISWQSACSPKYCRVGAASQRFLVVVMWLAAALVDEIARLGQVLCVPRDAPELDQRQLDFLVTAVAALLTCAGAEHAC